MLYIHTYIYIYTYNIHDMEVSKNGGNYPPNRWSAKMTSAMSSKEWSTSPWETCWEHVPSSCRSWRTTSLRANWSMSQVPRWSLRYIWMSKKGKAVHFGGDWNMTFIFHIYWECHHPNWRTHIVQRGWTHQPDFMAFPYSHVSLLDGNPRIHQMQGDHSGVYIVDLSFVEGRVDRMGHVWEGHLTRNIVEEWYRNRMIHVFFDRSAPPLMLGAWWCGCLCVEGWDLHSFPLVSGRAHSTWPSQEFPGRAFPPWQSQVTLWSINMESGSIIVDFSIEHGDVPIRLLSTFPRG